MSASPPKPQYADRTAEARAWVTKAKLHLNNSRNLKSEIKSGVVEAVDRLYIIIKELEGKNKKKEKEDRATVRIESTEPTVDATFTVTERIDLLAQLKEHTELIKNNNKKMEELSEALKNQKEILEKTTTTYAEVAAKTPTHNRTTLHSVVITSKKEAETGDHIMTKLRKVVDAKEGWVKVERVRKARDRKVIMGFQSTEERDKVVDRLKRNEDGLDVEKMINRDPLLVLKNVLSVNTDEDILKALRNQNKEIYRGLNTKEDRTIIKYRRRTRNPHMSNVVVSVAPTIWRRAINQRKMHVDLQQVAVEDQSPLVQCTNCLGYGHGRRFCKEEVTSCSHCGGPHLRADCTDLMAGTAPSCRNCCRAKMEQTGHNAFSSECPVRARWDRMARDTVAYC